VLAEAGLVAPLSDAIKQKRTTHHVAEPALRLHQLIIAPNESRLTRHHSAEVWTEVAGTASKVGPTEVACQEHRCNHEIDVVVIEVLAQSADRVTALGEAKWRSDAVGPDQLTRLEHLRTLMKLPSSVKLLLFSRAGFTDALHQAATRRDDVELVDLPRLYTGS